MSKFSFKNYCENRESIDEMAKLDFGRQRGKHLNDLNADGPRSYPGWMLDNLDSTYQGRPSVGRVLSDKEGKPLSRQQLRKALELRLSGNTLAPTSINEPPRAADNQPRSQTQPQMSNASSDDDDQEIELSTSSFDSSLPPEDFDSSKYTIDPAKISDYQKAIEEAFLNSNKHLVINALAGTGKSTVLKHLAGKFSSGQRWLYLVFNKKNQQEASTGPKSFPPNVKVSTSHSFLFDVLRRTKKAKPNIFKSNLIPARKLKKVMDSNWFFESVMKLRNSIPRGSDKREGTWMIWGERAGNPSPSYYLKTRVEKLTSLAKNYAINPKDPDVFSKVKRIFGVHQDDKELTPYLGKDRDPGPDFTDEIVQLTIETLKQTSSTGAIGDRDLDSRIDFDDMIWWPTLHADEAVWPGKQDYKVALVDEVQDFNEAQKVMIENLARNGIRIIVVGDPHQAIYGWRGALNGFSNIESLLASTAEGSESRTLPVNYRSGKKILEFVKSNTHVKDLAPGLPHDGKVNQGVSARGMVDEITDEFHTDKTLKEETAFISRTNAPLFGMAIHFLKEGVPFKILGSDFSKEINDFIYTVAGEGKISVGRKNASNIGIDRFVQYMERYVDDENRIHGNKKAKEDHLKQISKLSEALYGFIEYENNKSPISSAEDMCDRIRAIFKGLDVTGAGAKEKDIKAYEALDRKRTVFLTTAHRSKGLEFTRVNIIDNGKFPKGDKPDSSNWKSKEEHNIKYVAYTRATHTLNISDDVGLDPSDNDKGKRNECFVWRSLCSDLLRS